VFQFKHHVSASAKDAIAADALSQAAKIERYRTPGNSRYEQWERTEQWQLVTNAVFNPTDQQQWDEKVVPRFKQFEARCRLLGARGSERFLAEYPWIDRAFLKTSFGRFKTVAAAREKSRSCRERR